MEIVDLLQETEEAVLRYFELDEADMQRTYSPGKWNIRQLLLHLTDADTVLLERIKRGIAKPGQVIYAFDQDAWADVLDYNKRSLLHAKAMFIATRAVIKELATDFYISHGANEYVHNETGKRTVKDEFDKVVLHTKHHLEQMGVALGTC